MEFGYCCVNVEVRWGSENGYSNFEGESTWDWAFRFLFGRLLFDRLGFGRLLLGRLLCWGWLLGGTRGNLGGNVGNLGGGGMFPSLMIYEFMVFLFKVFV